ncbi:MAG TPA: 3'-5' exonuclease [Polyangiaceae bacterium]|nr:3'-5' exonuclease [Polyangiaceae bacterium]
MIKFFNTPWASVPIISIDTECTGKQPGKDRAVSVGLSRFENGICVGTFEQFVNPGMPISEEAIGVHKITDAMVASAPTIHEVFSMPSVVELLAGAQPCGYNSAFDRHFVPPFGDDWTWPWLDALALVRKQDRYAKGNGRHKLEAACARHGVTLLEAHSAGADARAAGELLIKLGRELFPKGYTLGDALGWCRRAEAEEWFRFNAWLSVQPQREAGAA